MRKLSMLVVTLGLLLSVTSEAQAAGCLKGAAAGAAVGHLKHHAVIGAVVGCAVGHHLASKKQANAAEKH
jgi:phage tail tape-measure protein